MKKLIILLSVVLLSLVLMCSCGSADSDYRGDYNNQAPTAPEVDGETTDKLYGDHVIKNAYVNSETKEFDNALNDLKALISEYEGYIYSSNTNVDSSYYNEGQQLRFAEYTVKIPAEKFDTFIDALGNILNVTRVSTSTADASDEYYDLEAVVTTYRTKREALVAMLENVDKSIDFSTWQEINKELTELEIELSRYEAQLRDLQNKVAYSTVTINISEVAELTPAEEVGYGTELLDAIKDSLAGTLEFFKGLLVVIIYILPFVIINGVIALIIVLCVRKGSKKRAARRAAQAAQCLNPPNSNMNYPNSNMNYPNNNNNNNQ